MHIKLTYQQQVEGITQDAKTVIESWGLMKGKEHKICNIELPIEWNKIYYFCGYSGSGKSSIIREIHKQLYPKQTYAPYSLTYIDNYKTYLEELDGSKFMIDYFPKVDFNRRLKMLAKCGLNEVWKYITKIEDLSDGEKFRFVLYHNLMFAMELQKDAYIIIDEFCSTLDRITAKVVSQNINSLRSLMNKEGLKVTFILASAHDDLIDYINADYTFFKEFQPQITQIDKK